MTGPIRGSDGFPRTDIVQPVPPANAVNKDPGKKEEAPKEKPAVESELEKARRRLQEIVDLQERAKRARDEGHLDEQA